MARAALGWLESQCWIVIFAGAGASFSLMFFMILGALTVDVEVPFVDKEPFECQKPPADVLAGWGDPSNNNPNSYPGLPDTASILTTILGAPCVVNTQHTCQLAWYWRARCGSIYDGSYMAKCMVEHSDDVVYCEKNMAQREAECGLLQLSSGVDTVPEYDATKLAGTDCDDATVDGYGRGDICNPYGDQVMRSYVDGVADLPWASAASPGVASGDASGAFLTDGTVLPPEFAADTDCESLDRRSIQDIGKATKCTSHPDLAWQTLLYMTGETATARCSYVTYAATAMLGVLDETGETSKPGCRAPNANNALIGNRLEVTHVEKLCNYRTCPGTLPNIDFSGVNTACPDVAVTDTCAQVCVAGYEPSSGTGLYRCNMLGKWVADGGLQCVPKVCVSDSPGWVERQLAPELAAGNTGGSNSQYDYSRANAVTGMDPSSTMCSGRFNEPCEVRCDDGFVAVDAENVRNGIVEYDGCQYLTGGIVTRSGIRNETITGGNPLCNEADKRTCDQGGALTINANGENGPTYAGGGCVPNVCTNTGSFAGVTTGGAAVGARCVGGNVLVGESVAAPLQCSSMGSIAGGLCTALPLSGVSATTYAGAEFGDNGVANGYGDVNYATPGYKIASGSADTFGLTDMTGPCGRDESACIGTASAKSGFQPAQLFDRDMRTGWMSNLGYVTPTEPAWFQFEFTTAPASPVVAISMTPYETQSKYFPREFVVVAGYQTHAEFAQYEAAQATAGTPVAVYLTEHGPHEFRDNLPGGAGLNDVSAGPISDGPRAWEPVGQSTGQEKTHQFWTRKVLASQAGSAAVADTAGCVTDSATYTRGSDVARR